jgi:hypothetical protein
MYKPNKDYEFYYNSMTKDGIRYHDNFFKDYYQYMYERDENEQFFNKFGKRFQYDDELVTMRKGMSQFEGPAINRCRSP